MHIPMPDGVFIDEETGYYNDTMQVRHRNEDTVTKPHIGYNKRHNKRMKKSKTELSRARAQKFKM